MRALMTPEQFEAADRVRQAGQRLADSRAQAAEDLEMVRAAIEKALEAGVNYRDLIEPSGMSSRYVWLVMDRLRRESDAA